MGKECEFYKLSRINQNQPKSFTANTIWSVLLKQTSCPKIPYLHILAHQT